MMTSQFARHRGKRLFIVCTSLLLLLNMDTQAQKKRLVSGMKITSSTSILHGTYNFNKAKGQVITIEGNNITVDFNHAVMNGNLKNAMPDSFSGIAINILRGNNITIKNLTAKGYKVALMAKGIRNLTIEQCDFSYNYRQHLNSTQQKEDLSDWMSYHHNENDEWLRYGAGMYLRNCNRAVLHDNKVSGGQCALMLTQCDSGLVYNNDFSFNSGLGIGMYRSSDNKVVYNKLDFNVRGHSEGVYNRGQDAAAILVFEQCNKNVFAYNTATHSGDGFFLWAGQTTIDSGYGGCNDNLVLANDFSYAPTNGIEVTFSRNQLLGNILKGCDNGIWGGYSYNTNIYGNQFEKNKVAIAIEHGQQNEILFNTFRQDETAIKLWANKQSPPEWGYSKKRDTRSYDYLVAGNHFVEVGTAVAASVTDKLRMGMNEYTNCRKNFVGGELVTHLDSSWKKKDSLELRAGRAIITGIPDNIQPRFTSKNIITTKPRSEIRMTEWGPYDFKSPLLWNTNPADNSDTLQFDILGPPGLWEVLTQRGVKVISTTMGFTPGKLTAVRTNQKGSDVYIQMAYTGGPVVTMLGKKIPARQRQLFSYRNNLLPADWRVNWYAFDSLHNPVTDTAALQQVISQPPIKTASVTDLHFAWWNGVDDDKKQERFVTIAETDVDFPPGQYVLAASWEDVLRVYADGKLVLNEWKSAPHAYDESPHREIPVRLQGKHHLRVEQANQGGFATLIIKLKKK